MWVKFVAYEMGGGINVSANSFDSFWPKVSIEQVYEWNPEYIFYPPYAPFDETTFLEAWGDLTAVKEKKVFRFPSSLEAWDYPVHSSILGALWIAAKLHPDLYSSNALVKDIEDYYSCFYHVKFSAKELI